MDNLSKEQSLKCLQDLLSLQFSKMRFHKMRAHGDNYTIKYIQKDLNTYTLDGEYVEKSFEYAYDMSFGEAGKHRDHRSGGTSSRKYGAIFKDAFQGKLAECALYEYLKSSHVMTVPCFDVWGEGRWDDQDFFIDGSPVSVKSTKKCGNLLLLETQDYDKDGSYIPNKGKDQAVYKYTIMVRIDPSCEDIMKKNRLLYSNKVLKQELKELILNEEWVYDIPGYITDTDLVHIIRYNFVIPKGATLNSSTVMDASNYYVQSGDLRDIDRLGE